MAYHRVLFVAGDGICVAPYLAIALARSLHEPRGDYEWDVTALSVDGRESLPICPLLLDQVTGSVAQYARAHRTQRVRVTDLSRAHIILTATTEDRSAVARLALDARSRTFTVREALLLGASTVTMADVRAATLPGRAAASLRTYADILNSRRGTVDPHRSRWAGLQPGERQEPLDLPDPHRRVRAHAKVLERVDGEVAALARNLQQFVEITEPRL